MTRQAFMQTLKRGLSGLPPTTVQDILADYETHFAEGLSAGRSEDEVAAALGDPARLARELRAEAGLKRWKEERNPAAAAGMVLAVMGLATIDIFILMPVLIIVGSVLFALFMGAIAIMLVGLVGIAAAAMGSSHLSPGPISVAFGSLGLMCLSIALGAVLVPIVIGLLDVLGRYARLHFQLLQPALKSQASEGQP